MTTQTHVRTSAAEVHALAHRKRSGKDIKIVFTGLRPNEKMHEVLFGEIEDAVPTSHPKISQVPVPPLSPDAVRAMDGRRISEMDVIHRG